ncbi:MAG TPA: D-glycerate dehydrogenase [Gemmatimonadales bacterium]|nr:D-glycerate dehydrogenase [Gemmatimonadales bacterium]
MQQRPVVAVTRRLPATVMEALARRFTLHTPPVDDAPPAPGVLANLLRDCDAVLCTVTDAIGRETIEAGPVRTRILANFGAGTNHIDVEAARQAGIAVTNTPDQLTETTADLTMALMLMTLRRLGEGERILRAGRWAGWRPTDFLGHDLHGRRLGLVGFGRIGQAVARRAALGFGMRVVAVGRHGPPSAAMPSYVAAARGLDEMLGDVEVVSLHLPASAETRHLFNRERLVRMRPGAWLINTARGSVVDEEALADAVATGHLAGAGLDVFEEEPQVHPQLLDLPGVVLLPHMGSATVAAREAMGMRAVANLEAFFSGQPLLDPVVVP